MAYELNLEDQQKLLSIAREAITKAVNRERLPEIDISYLPPALQEPGSSFVTLTNHQQLRGCIGTLEAYQALAEDVQEHAVAAALQDFRFSPITPGELPDVQIEVSVLTPKQPLNYDTPEDLLNKIRPHVDGIVLQDGFRKATFLPQVWEKLPNPKEFLAHLCLKMGAPAHLWQKKKLDIFTYQVQEFHE
jgi:AmmeMemoRadiSam system protein A